MDDRETWLDQVSPTFHLNVMLHRASVLQRALRPPAWRLARLATRPATTAVPGHDEKKPDDAATAGKRAMSTQAPRADDARQLAGAMAALAAQAAEARAAAPAAREADVASFATKCASVAHAREATAASLAPPIHLASTYLMKDAAHGARLHGKEEGAYADADGYVYSRWGSPTTEAAARQIAALEAPRDAAAASAAGGEVHSMLFSSGMAAITASLMAVLRAGDHAVFPHCVYGGTHEFLMEFATRWGIDVSFVDANEGAAAYAAACTSRTKVLYCETPANPTCRLTDLAAIGALARALPSAVPGLAAKP